MDIGPGALIDCQIEPPVGDPPVVDSDQFRFAGLAGEKFLIVVTALTEPEPIPVAGGPCLDLRDPDDLPVGTGFFCAFSRARAELILAKSGTHTIIVSEFGDNRGMTYRVSLERVFPPWPLATRLGYGETALSGQTVDVGGVKLFQFAGAADSTVQIQVTRTGGGNPCLELIDPDGVFQRQQSSPRPPSAASEACGFSTVIISPVLTKSGTYTILVNEAGRDQTMTFTIALDCLSSSCPTGPTGPTRPRDFDGDGKGDILWRHISGATAIWLMSGDIVIGSGFPGSVAPEWTIAGVGDFNGDGKADILWRHTSGLVVLWLMNGTSLAAQGSPGSADLG
jgi:hypothetical protein